MWVDAKVVLPQSSCPRAALYFKVLEGHVLLDRAAITVAGPLVDLQKPAYNRTSASSCSTCTTAAACARLVHSAQ